jgi:hypothetical protein
VSIGVPLEASSTVKQGDRGEPTEIMPRPERPGNSAPEKEGLANARERDTFPLTMPIPAPAEKPVPIYFTPQELHQHPIPVGRVLSEEEGRVYPDSVTNLSIYVSNKGRADKVVIAATNNPALAAEFAEQFRNVRYVPGKISGLSVNSELRVEVFSKSSVVHNIPMK